MTNGQPKRSSVFTGVVLIALGALFLLNRFDPLLSLGHMIRMFWPILIILWGVAKLFDHLAARSSGHASPSLLSGTEAVALVILVFVLLGFVLRDHIREHFPEVDFDLTPFRQSYSQTQEVAPQTIPAGARVAVDTTRGNVTVHVGEGNALQVSATESASAGSESDADARMKKVQVLIEHTGNTYTVHPLHQEDSRPAVRVDLDIETPKTVSVSVHTARGDIAVTGISGAVDARSESGGIEVHDVGSDVTAAMDKGDTRISRVGGNVKIRGRGDDIEIADVLGDATIEGDFFGSTRVRKVAKTTHFASPQTELTAVQLKGTLELDSDNLGISDVAGPTRILTHDKDVEVDDVAGPLDISNSHGDIKVSNSAPPREDVNITNNSGGVEIVLPEKSGFAIAAVSRSGDIDSDFEGPMLKSSDDSGSGELMGQFGTPGPKITIRTSYGTIELHKFMNAPADSETRPGHLPTAFHFRLPRHGHSFAARGKKIS